MFAPPVLSEALARYSLFATMPTQIRSQPTHRNRLSPKGLPVTQTRLFRNARLICVLGALAAPGFQTITAAQTAPPRGPTQTQARLRLSGGQSAASQGERITHLIRRGETLTSISRRYGTTVAAVQAWNGLRGSRIRAGQQLTILTGSLPQAAAGGAPVTHVIRRGETLTSISRRYGTTVAAVQEWNGLRGSTIRAGRRLTIYTTRAAAAEATTGPAGERVTHLIQRGETLSSIARYYGTTVRAVQASNGLRGSTIRAGRRLTVFTTRAAAAVSTAGTAGFKLDENGDQVPDLRSQAAIIYNPATGQVLWEENARSQRSIASITKVMTAVVFLEDSPDLSREVVIDRADVRRASVTYLRAGDKISTGDLLHLQLIASDNAAARALARVSPQGSTGFVVRMNQKAAELGLTNTHYDDPSGLRAGNVSSAYDMARLIAYVGGDERIASIMQKQRYRLTVGRRQIAVRSTNQLVRDGEVDVISGKTGFIRRAGYCLVTLLRLPQGGPQVAVVVLGARSSAERFGEALHLINWLASRAQDLLAVPVQAAVATGS